MGFHVEQAVVFTDFSLHTMVGRNPVQGSLHLAVGTFHSALADRIVFCLNLDDVSFCILGASGTLHNIGIFRRTSLPGVMRKNFFGASSMKSPRSIHRFLLKVMVCVPSASFSGLLIASISSLSPSG